MGLDLLPEQCSLSLSSSAKGSINIKAQHHRRHSQDQNQFDSRQMVQSNNSKINRKKMNNNSYHEEISGSRSLPETPRISSARRSDVDASRLSLQINKENAMITEEFDHNLRRPSSREQIKLRRKDYHSRHHHHHDEENRNPSQYARQLVKQVKESVSRRVGVDITNTTTIAKSLDITNADHRETMASSKSKKRNCPTKTSDQEAHQIKHSTSSSSPRIRSQEHKIKPSPDQIPAVSKPLPILPSLAPVTEHCNQLQSKVTNLRTKSLQLPRQRTIDKYKKASCERFTQRKEPPIKTSPVAKANNLPEKKCKKTPLLKDLVGQVTKLEQSISSNQAHHNAQAVPTHPSQTTQQQRQQPRIGFQVQVSKPIISQLSSSSSRVAASYHENHYHHQVTLPFDCRDDNINRSTSTGRSSSSSSSSSDAEFRYVTEILKRPGIDRDTIVSFTARWFSPSHPLDPSIFEYLEQQQQQHPSPLTQRHNRKLIFDLVDEILVDILKPHLNMKPWLRSITKRYDLPVIKHKLINGNQLLQQLCSKIQTFPSANCQILQDIDDLIELDLPDYSTNQLLTILPILEEGEWIVFEIERDLLDALVLETASAILARPPAPASWSDAV